MKFLRIILFMVSLAGAFICFYLISINNVKLRSNEAPLAWLGLALASLNCLYLFLCPPPYEDRSRLSRLIGLWFDAKEKELQERGSKRDKISN